MNVEKGMKRWVFFSVKKKKGGQIDQVKYTKY